MKIQQEHYNHLAKVFQEGLNLSMEDEYIRKQEMLFLKREIKKIFQVKKNIKIADFGCGNGSVIKELEKDFQESMFYGLEVNQSLFDLCKSQNPNIKYFHGDMINFKFQEQFDCIFTERSIINILDAKKQDQAMQNIVKHLLPGGKYLMIESFKRPLRNLNSARKENTLPALFPSKYNRYLSEGWIRYLEKLGLKEISESSNLLSTHFFNARVLHPILRIKGATLKNSQLVKFFDQALPKGVGDYSPILFRVFEKEL
jgi:ubiquinone/menaquinone biosynthesis C-methylase UbiE